VPKRGVVPEPQATRLVKLAQAADIDLPEAAREARAAGGSIREIARLANRSTNTIQRWLKEKQ